MKYTVCYKWGELKLYLAGANKLTPIKGLAHEFSNQKLANTRAQTWEQGFSAKPDNFTIESVEKE
jgi:hypothetical protein